MRFKAPSRGVRVEAPSCRYRLSDEFIFRFNRRKSKARGLLFYRLIGQAVDLGPVSRAMIADDRPQHLVGG